MDALKNSGNDVIEHTATAEALPAASRSSLQWGVPRLIGIPIANVTRTRPQILCLTQGCSPPKNPGPECPEILEPS